MNDAGTLVDRVRYRFQSNLKFFERTLDERLGEALIMRLRDPEKPICDVSYLLGVISAMRAVLEGVEDEAREMHENTTLLLKR